jgi:hypothetical protein
LRIGREPSGFAVDAAAAAAGGMLAALTGLTIDRRPAWRTGAAVFAGLIGAAAARTVLSQRQSGRAVQRWRHRRAGEPFPRSGRAKS